MTPRRLEADVVQRRLRMIEESLADLRLLAGRSAEDLAASPLDRAAAERFIQVVVDLAVDVNGHLAVAAGASAPETGRESFLAVAAAGALSDELSAALAPSTGLHNILVHRYGDIRLDLLAAGITSTLELYPGYVEQIAAYLLDRSQTGE